MNLQQLQYFRHLAETEHLRQAADDLFISPPALSVTISRLEEELGSPLFNHVGRNIKLNDKGKKFYSHVVHILSELDDAVAEVKATDSTQSVNVWTTTNVSWGDVFADFIYTHSGIVFSSRMVDVSMLSQISQEEHPDFIITPLSDLSIEQYDYEILIDNDAPLLIVGPGHPLSKRSEITLAEVVDEPFVLLPESYSMRQYVDKLFAMTGYTPKIFAEADPQLRSKLIKAGKGISITTEWASHSYILSGLCFIKITEPSFPRTQVIAWPKGRHLTGVGQEFLSFITNYMHSLTV